MADKSVREELAELTEAVRELREDEVTAELRRLRAEVEKLRAAKDGHHCHGCSCMHIHWYPNTWTYPATVTYPNYTVTSGTVTAAPATNYYLTAGSTTTLTSN